MNPPAAVLIGALAGALVVGSVLFVERVLKLDDPVGAVSVHGTCGAWVVLALGLFADGTYGDKWNSVAGTVRGLFYGDASQLLAQVIDVAVNIIFVFCLTWVIFKIIDAIIGMRVTAEVEQQGLDPFEMGSHAYPDFAMARTQRVESINAQSQ